MKQTDLALQYYEKHNLDSDVIAHKKHQADVLIRNLGNINIRSNAKILDVGCGVGVFGAQLQNKFQADVHGIDLAKSAVTVAKHQGIKAKLADIDSTWDYHDSFFDMVFAVQVIEHVYNPDNLLKEARRVLKKGGLLIITTPNLAAWYNRLILLFGYQPFFTEVSTVDKTLGLDFTRNLTVNRETVGHLRVFTLRALLDISRFYGFSLNNIKGAPVDYLPKFMQIPDKIISNLPAFASDLIVVLKK